MLLLVEQEKDTGQLFKVSFNSDCKYRVELSINVFEKEAKDYDIKGILTFLVKTSGFLVKTFLHINSIY